MMDAYDPKRDGFSNARLMMVTSRLTRLIASETADLAYGAWNPLFCEAAAAERALEVFANLRNALDHYEAQAREALPEKVAA